MATSAPIGSSTVKSIPSPTDEKMTGGTISTPASTPGTPSSSISSANSPLPEPKPTQPTPPPPQPSAPANKVAFLEDVKPVYVIVGVVAGIVHKARNITGANRELHGASDKALAIFVKFSITILITFTGGLILIPFAPFITEWRKQGKFNLEFENWVKTNNFATIRLHEVVTSVEQKATANKDAALKKAEANARTKIEPLEKELQTLKGGKIDQLVKEVAHLQGEIAKLTATTAALEKLRDEGNTRVGQLTLQLEEGGNRYKNDIQVLTNKEKEGATKLATLQDQLKKATLELAGFRELATKEKDAFQQQVNTLKAAKEAAEKQVTALAPAGAAGVAATEQVAKLTAQVKGLEARLLETSGKLEQANKDLAQGGEQDKKAQTINSQLNEKLVALKDEKASLAEQVTQLQLVIDKGDAAGKEAAALADKVKDLNLQLQKATLDLSNANDKVKAGDDQYKALQKTNAELQATVAENQNLYKQTKTEYDTVLKNYTDAKGTVEGLTKEKATVEAQLKEAQTKAGTADAAGSVQIKELTWQSEQLNQKLRSALETVENLSLEKNQLTKQLQDSKELFTTTVSASDKAVAGLKTIIAQSKQETQEVRDQLEQKIRELDEEKSNLEKQLHVAVAEQENALARADSANEKVESLTDKLQKAKQSLLEQGIKTTGKIDSLSQDLAVATRAKEAAEKLLEQTKGEKGRVEGADKESEGRIADLTQKLTEKETKCLELSQELEQAKQAAIDAVAPLNEQIANLRIGLQAQTDAANEEAEKAGKAEKAAEDLFKAKNKVVQLKDKLQTELDLASQRIELFTTEIQKVKDAEQAAIAKANKTATERIAAEGANVELTEQVAQLTEQVEQLKADLQTAKDAAATAEKKAVEPSPNVEPSAKGKHKKRSK